MKNFRNIIAFLFTLTLFLAIPFDSRSNSITIATSQNWSAITGGSGTGGAPGSADVITINGGATVTVNVSNAICSTLLVSHQAVLTFNSNSQLTVGATGTGPFTLGVSGGSGRWATLTMTSGATLKCGNITSANTANVMNTTNGTMNIAVSGSVTLGANIKFPNLIISGGHVTLGSGTVLYGNITINPACTLSQGANSISLPGNFINNGTFIFSTGFFDLTGPSVQTIGGSTETIFYVLRITNTGGAILGASITVNTSLVLYGPIDINNYNLTMGRTANNIINSPTCYVITKNDPLSGGCLIQYSNGSKFYPVGTSTFTPVIVENTGAPDYFKVRVFDSVYTAGTSGTVMTSCVNRTWLIDEAVPDSSNVKLTMQWNAGEEIGSFNRNNCAVLHYTGGEWEDSVFAPAINYGWYNRTRGSVTSFSPFAVGDDNITPLPVELISFSAQNTNKVVELSWTTATEINNSHFDIERSADGKEFEAIGRSEGAGNSNRIVSYQFTDNDPLAGNVSYYRLKQVDFDGASSYSSVQAIRCIENSIVPGDIYPMPAQGSVSIPFHHANNGNCVAEIYDLSGKILFSQEFNIPAGSQVLALSTSELKPGVYIISLKNDQEQHSLKLIK